MIYVPMLKNRKAEITVVNNMNGCFSDKIIPLLEVLADTYEVRYMLDPLTDDFIYTNHGKSKRRVKEIPTDKDIITLQNIKNILKEKLVFIDYFRFNIKKYGKKIKASNVDLALRFNNDENLYKERVKEISRFPNMIPVVSIKAGFDMNKTELKAFLQELQKENDSVALRITEEWLEKYKDIMKNVLRPSDYLLFDISEQNPKSKFMEIEELNELKISVQIILLNSPRKASIKNGEYNIHGTTDLIDNCASDMALEYGLQGYGDYCGLKDALPSDGGGGGIGAALALFYDYNSNSFYSYLEPDTSIGLGGYKKIIPIILADKGILDNINDCPAIKMIEKMKISKKSGSWSTWHSINATRYIYQVYKHI